MLREFRNMLRFIPLAVVFLLVTGYPTRVSKRPSENGVLVNTTGTHADAVTVNGEPAGVCQDGHSTCPTDQTCCKQPSGIYGCCALPNAVCCKDGLHCCPNDYACQDDGTCTDLRKPTEVPNQGRDQPEDITAGYPTLVSEHPLVNKVVHTAYSNGMKNKEPMDVNCPGGKSACPDNQTCCMEKSGIYGCCPLPFAVCCNDGVHCCPLDYACQNDGTCTDLRDREPVPTEPVPTHPDRGQPKAVSDDNNNNYKNIICPDNLGECPTDNTCCPMSNNKYGCCPLPNAVCCADNLKCCPRGYTCHGAESTCQIMKTYYYMPATPTNSL